MQRGTSQQIAGILAVLRLFRRVDDEHETAPWMPPQRVTFVPRREVRALLRAAPRERLPEPGAAAEEGDLHSTRSQKAKSRTNPKHELRNPRQIVNNLRQTESKGL